MDKNIGFQQHAIEKQKLVALEQRMLSFQRDLEVKSQDELSRQVIFIQKSWLNSNKLKLQK